LFSVPVTYLGTAMVGMAAMVVNEKSDYITSIYNRLAGMNTTTNPKNLVTILPI
jgi:hypothetical protein